MALSVKAYIHPDTNQQEIRRFAVDEGVSASYAYLAQKIEQVFPVVRGKIFKLFWKGKAYLVYFDFKFARWEDVPNTGSNADKHFFALILQSAKMLSCVENCISLSKQMQIMR